jgi:hypothetical protein
LKEKEELFDKNIQKHEEQKAKEYEALRLKKAERMENIKKGVNEAREVYLVVYLFIDISLFYFSKNKLIFYFIF